MENAYKNFYRNFYMRTGGYIPAKPLNSVIYPGDFFQIKNGEIIILGNLFRDAVIDPAEAAINYRNKLNANSWNFNDGLSKPYSGRTNGHDITDGNFEYSKQVLAFAKRGSFIFHSTDPETTKIANWMEIQQQLIIKLTQTYYSFREVYVVTEIADTSAWSLAIAAEQNAELEIASEDENFGLTDIFGHQSTKTIQSRDIEFYHKESSRKPCFFKAKKLVVNDEKMDYFMSELINRRAEQQEWAKSFYDIDINNDAYNHYYIPAKSEINPLDMLSGNELNPNTALLYFRWADASLDDVERLFSNYA
ncbi:hypothetical protein E0W68_10940 [Flavobacterium salilacus subsp. salilacus]|uniref:hypothetical protein n=1 Tax=Flavobacterium TaxID=237 RepID=UPI001074ECAB|nr:MULTISPECIES: hypothetical protein [Flavobacterium]KAF2517480.1 hypothetical protein E0W68_10940 [Flavobacterium salilacus subsp. salilacus]MBE1615624.1 hypothetical protein [Flavobacterium sp. SaA2.13]